MVSPGWQVQDKYTFDHFGPMDFVRASRRNKCDTSTLERGRESPHVNKHIFFCLAQGKLDKLRITTGGL